VRALGSREVALEPFAGHGCAGQETVTEFWYILVEDAMAKNTSVVLGDHFEAFIREQLEQGRYGSASEVVRASLRLLEEHEHKVRALRQALVEGEESGDAGALDMAAIRRKARRKAGLPPENA
jgi:antitoxin ParD1/3/4